MNKPRLFLASIMLPMVDKEDIHALKSFAVTMSLAFTILFMLILPWLFSMSVPLWPLAIAVVLLVLYVVAPRLIYYPYCVWMLIASVLGFINTRVILAIAYYVIIVPTGLVMQWRKGLQYKHTSHEPSTWVKRETLPTKDNLKDPF